MGKRGQRRITGDAGAEIQDGAADSARALRERAEDSAARNKAVAAKLQRFARAAEIEQNPLQDSDIEEESMAGSMSTGRGEEEEAAGTRRQEEQRAEPSWGDLVEQNKQHLTALQLQVPDEPTNKDVMLAVVHCGTAISHVLTQLGYMQESMQTMRHDLHAVKDRTGQLEKRMSAVEGTASKSVQRHKELQKDMTAVWAKTDDLENRSRRNNVRIVGLPEHCEGKNPTTFIETWLKEKVGADNLTHLYAVERAHRVPSRPLPPGHPPRPVLAKILHYRDRDIILKYSREHPDLSVDGSRVSFYPDFSPEVQKMRAKFTDIKRRLRASGVKYSMLFPAKLRVEAWNKVHFFLEPKEAMDWLDLNEQQLGREGKEQEHG